MTDYSRDRLGPQDEDRLPWLEPVEEEFDEGGGISTGKLVTWAVAALVVVAVIVGAFLWLRGRDAGAAGDGGLIKAPDAYYKERPVEQAAPTDGDEIVYSASKGNEVASVIDISGAAETPVNVDRTATPAVKPAPPVPAVKTVPVPAAAKPATSSTTATVDGTVVKQTPKAPPKPKPAIIEAAAPIASGGSMVQLGAFSSEAKAKTAWKTLSGRFGFLSGLSESVIPIQSGEKTLYRLRASGGNAGDICKRLRTAGESCSVIG